MARLAICGLAASRGDPRDRNGRVEQKKTYQVAQGVVDPQFLQVLLLARKQKRVLVSQHSCSMESLPQQKPVGQRANLSAKSLHVRKHSGPERNPISSAFLTSAPIVLLQTQRALLFFFSKGLLVRKAIEKACQDWFACSCFWKAMAPKWDRVAFTSRPTLDGSLAPSTLQGVRGAHFTSDVCRRI